MKFDGAPWMGAVVVVILGFCLASCTNNSPPVSEAEYSAKIVGRWQGTVGHLKETMSIDGDGTFVGQLHPKGFIANTLSQSVTGTIRGTWKITGAIITPVSYTHLRAHETDSYLVCRLLLEKQK